MKSNPIKRWSNKREIEILSVADGQHSSPTAQIRLNAAGFLLPSNLRWFILTNCVLFFDRPLCCAVFVCVVCGKQQHYTLFLSTFDNKL